MLKCSYSFCPEGGVAVIFNLSASRRKLIFMAKTFNDSEPSHHLILKKKLGKATKMIGFIHNTPLSQTKDADRNSNLRTHHDESIVNYVITQAHMLHLNFQTLDKENIHMT